MSLNVNMTRGLLGKFNGFKVHFKCASRNVKPIGKSNLVKAGQRQEREILTCIPTPLVYFHFQAHHFHHQAIIQFHIQSSRVLFEALQKNGYSKSDIQDIKIPEELRGVKSGSLKWLFQFWPLPKNILRASYHEEKSSGRKWRKESQDPSGRLTNFDKEIGEKQLHEMVDYLKGKKIAIRRLIKLPWLLTAHPELVELAVKQVQQILRLEEFAVALSFANMTAGKLAETAAVWKMETPQLIKLSKKLQTEGNGETVAFKNRLEYLSYQLKVPKEDVSDIMVKVKRLQVMPLEDINKVLEFLRKTGIKPDFIANDPWVFINSISKMDARLRIVRENGITDFKPWILRTPKATFEKYISIQRDEMALLRDHEDRRGFLCEKLRCDDTAVAIVMKKVPALKNLKATNLNEMIEFLFSSGFTAKDILTTPRILAHSVDTISKRLNEITELGEPVTNLHVLCRPANQYKSYLNKLKEARESLKFPAVKSETQEPLKS